MILNPLISLSNPRMLMGSWAKRSSVSWYDLDTMKRNGPSEPAFRPPRLLTTMAASSALIFAFFFGIAIRADLHVVYLVFLAAAVLASVLGLADLLISRLRIGDREISIRSLFRKELVLFSEIKSLTMEGGNIQLLTQTGRRIRLPDWLGQNRIAAKEIEKRLK